jgi:hypothetical protein
MSCKTVTNMSGRANRQKPGVKKKEMIGKEMLQLN